MTRPAGFEHKAIFPAAEAKRRGPGGLTLSVDEWWARHPANPANLFPAEKRRRHFAERLAYHEARLGREWRGR